MQKAFVAGLIAVLILSISSTTNGSYLSISNKEIGGYSKIVIDVNSNDEYIRINSYPIDGTNKDIDCYLFNSNEELVAKDDGNPQECYIEYKTSGRSDYKIIIFNKSFRSGLFKVMISVLKG
jgi:hypothetical protein